MNGFCTCFGKQRLLSPYHAQTVARIQSLGPGGVTIDEGEPKGRLGACLSLLTRQNTKWVKGEAGGTGRVKGHRIKRIEAEPSPAPNVSVRRADLSGADRRSACEAGVWTRNTTGRDGPSYMSVSGGHPRSLCCSLKGHPSLRHPAFLWASAQEMEAALPMRSPKVTGGADEVSHKF